MLKKRAMCICFICASMRRLPRVAVPTLSMIHITTRPIMTRQSRPKATTSRKTRVRHNKTSIYARAHNTTDHRPPKKWTTRNLRRCRLARHMQTYGAVHAADVSEA